jgi:hypothetical protein
MPLAPFLLLLFNASTEWNNSFYSRPWHASSKLTIRISSMCPQNTVKVIFETLSGFSNVPSHQCGIGVSRKSICWQGIVSFLFYFLGVGWHWFRLIISAICPIVPALVDGWWWAWNSQRNEWQKNRSTRRKPVTVALCPPQIPHKLLWVWTRSTAVVMSATNTWAIALPWTSLTQKVGHAISQTVAGFLLRQPWFKP